MNTIEYWKERCRLAEELLMETPYSLSETKEQKIAHDRWNEFKTLPMPDVKPSFLNCKNCDGYYGININYKCFKCLQPLF